MCYESLGWFRRTRAKDSQKVVEEIRETERAKAPAPMQQPADNRDTRAREPEKTPA